MAERKNKRQRSIKQSGSTSQPKSRQLKNIADFVDFQEDKISYTTIGSDSLSSCTFVLVVGNLQHHSFAYLSHYPECLEIPTNTPTSTLLYFIDQISLNIEDHINKKPPLNSQQLQINDLNNLQLLIGGGTEEERDLIREAFTLLNNPNHNIQHLLKLPPSKYIYQHLKFKAIILNPITVLLSNGGGDGGGKGGASVPDDCALVVKYDCCTKVVDVFIEWVGHKTDCTIASLSFVFGESDPLKLSWKKEENEILSTKKKLESNKRGFQLFNNALDYVVKSVFDDRNGYPFDLNREITGHLKQFVENEHDPLVETDQTAKKFYYDFIDDIDKEQLNHFIDHDMRVHVCVETLSRQTKNNPLLIGEQGVDKRAIVIGLAQCIIRQQSLGALFKRLITLNVEALVAVANGRSEFEERLKIVLNEIKTSNSNVILFIDNIHRVIDEENVEGTTDAANLLKLILNEFQCVGTTSLEKYKKYIEKDPVLEGYFQRILVKEASVTDCVSTLRALKGRYESHFGVQILDPALILAAQLSDRYIMNSVLPAKAIRIINAACIHVKAAMRRQFEISNQLNVEKTSLSQQKDEKSKQCSKQGNEADEQRLNQSRKLKRKAENRHSQLIQVGQGKKLAASNDTKYTATPDLKKEIDKMENSVAEENIQQQSRLLSAVVEPNTIVEIVSQWNDLPVSKLGEIEEYRLSQLCKNLLKKIIGQDKAVGSIAEIFLKNRTDSSRRSQPMGSFLFLGPTGFGKTELAKTLALEIFNSTESMIRINMSQYSESHLVDGLIGASPNYDSFQRRGQLEEAVLRNPCVVILFDEIEKAHPRIWDALLQVLNNGYLINRQDQTVFFTYSIIILKSNVGAQYISQAIENPLSETTKDCVMKEVHLHFRPEFLNSLNIVFFQSLNINQLSSIIHLQLRSLEEHFKEEDIKISLTDEAVQSILKQSYNSTSGVRPLKNHVESQITTGLLKVLIQMNIAPHSHLTIETDVNDQYKVHVQSPQTTTSDTPMQ